MEHPNAILGKKWLEGFCYASEWRNLAYPSFVKMTRVLYTIVEWHKKTYYANDKLLWPRNNISECCLCCLGEEATVLWSPDLRTANNRDYVGRTKQT